MKRLSIAICVFNKFAFTKSCLSDLSKLPNDHEIIVIDNGSTDETKSQLEQSKEIIYYCNENNEGFAKGSNKAYLMSTAPNVLFLNNDIRVRNNLNNWTDPLIEKCNDGLVGPTMGLLDYNFSFIKESNSYIDNPLSYMSGWCLASSKEIWNKLIEPGSSGPFCEDFFCYFEDTNLGLSAKKLGIKMQIVDIPVVHFGRVSSAQINTNLLYKQSREIFIKKWKNKVK